MLLTIITITKDDLDGLARTLASTEVWRSADWVEQIVIDGGAVAVKSPDARIRFHRQVSTGIYGAFNEGLATARGEWIWFLNGGDAVHESLDCTWLATLLRTSAADLVAGGLVYDSGGGFYGHPPLHRLWPLVDSWIPHPATLVRRVLFERLGRFDESFRIAGDYEWWLRALCADSRIDLITVPFARFAAGGVSQIPEYQAVIFAEVSRSVKRHQSVLWQGVVKQIALFFRQWIKATISKGAWHG